MDVNANVDNVDNVDNEDNEDNVLIVDDIDTSINHEEDGIEPIEPTKYTLQLTDSDSEISCEFMCSICRSVLDKTIELPCGHTYCSTCIDAWIKINNTCPVCKTCFNPDEKHYSKKIDNIIKKLKVGCQYCEWNGEYYDYNEHKNLENTAKRCPMMRVTCNKCDTAMKSSDMKEHNNTICSFRNVSCEKCLSLIVFSEREQHLLNVCPMTEAKCSDECGYTGLRKDLTTHKNVCLFEDIDCPLTNYGCTKRIKRRDMDEHVNNSLEIHLACAHDMINDQKITIQNQRTEITNLKPNDGTYDFTVGDYILYKGDSFMVNRVINETKKIAILDHCHEFFSQEDAPLYEFEISQLDNNIRLCQ